MFRVAICDGAVKVHRRTSLFDRREAPCRLAGFSTAVRLSSSWILIFDRWRSFCGESVDEDTIDEDTTR